MAIDLLSPAIYAYCTILKAHQLGPTCLQEFIDWRSAIAIDEQADLEIGTHSTMAEAASPQVALKGVLWMEAQLLEVDTALEVEGSVSGVLRVEIGTDVVVNATYNVPHSATYSQVKAIVYHTLIHYDHPSSDKKLLILSYANQSSETSGVERIPISTQRDWSNALAYLKDKFGTSIWRLRIHEADSDSKHERRSCITMQDLTMQEVLKLRDETNRAVSLATFGDMSEQKANQLRASRAKFTGVFRQMPWMKAWFDAGMRCVKLREKLVKLDANQMQSLAYARKEVQSKLSNLIKIAEKLRNQIS